MQNSWTICLTCFIRGRPSENAAANDAPANRVINKQQNHRAHHRYDEAIESKVGYSGLAKKAEEPPPDHRAHDAEQCVEHHSLATVVDEMTGDEARDQTKKNPCEQRHISLLLRLSRRVSTSLQQVLRHSFTTGSPTSAFLAGFPLPPDSRLKKTDGLFRAAHACNLEFLPALLVVGNEESF